MFQKSRLRKQKTEKTLIGYKNTFNMMVLDNSIVKSLIMVKIKVIKIDYSCEYNVVFFNKE